MIKSPEPAAINKIILGDNLEIMRGMPEECVDLIYLDPPFFSNKNYEVIWDKDDVGETRSFQDRWSGGIEQYTLWLKERIEQMHRLLKPIGSIFLHCDWHASHYIKVDILDEIFGKSNFRNEIIWCYKKWSVAEKSFSKNHDTIFFYSKTDHYTYNQLFQERADSTLKRFGNKKIVSGFNKQGKRIPSQTKEEQSDGVKMYDWWDVPIIPPSGKERIGYPTQKPEALMDRIIQCASNEGDIVLDPFLGGGTTAVVADKLHRRWIGIDQSVQAVKVTDLRFQQHPEYFSEYTVQLHKYDYDKLRYDDPFDFQTWIVQQYGGIPNMRKTGDMGIDGKMQDGTPIQAKRSDDIGRNVLDNFLSAAKRSDSKLFAKNQKEGRPVGVIIAFSFGKGAKQEVARLKLHEKTIIKLVTVEEITPFAKKPTMTVDVKEVSRSEIEREIEFTALADSEAGIAFYSWDFSYNEKKFNPDVIREKKNQLRYKFKPGSHRIAVKVIDNEGLEGFEVFTLTLNGRIKRSK